MSDSDSVTPIHIVNIIDSSPNIPITSVLSISPAQIVLGSADNTIRLWVNRPEFGKEFRLAATFTGHTDFITALTFIPSSKEYRDGIIVSGSMNGELFCWDVMTTSLIDKIDGHNDMISTLKYVPEVDIMYSVSHDGTICTWKNRQLLRRLFHPTSFAHRFVLMTVEPECFITCSNSSQLEIWKNGRCVEAALPNIVPCSIAKITDTIVNVASPQLQLTFINLETSTQSSPGPATSGMNTQFTFLCPHSIAFIDDIDSIGHITVDIIDGVYHPRIAVLKTTSKPTCIDRVDDNESVCGCVDGRAYIHGENKDHWMTDHRLVSYHKQMISHPQLNIADKLPTLESLPPSTYHSFRRYQNLHRPMLAIFHEKWIPVGRTTTIDLHGSWLHKHVKNFNDFHLSKEELEASQGGQRKITIDGQKWDREVVVKTAEGTTIRFGINIEDNAYKRAREVVEQFHFSESHLQEVVRMINYHRDELDDSGVTPSTPVVKQSKQSPFDKTKLPTVSILPDINTILPVIPYSTVPKIDPFIGRLKEFSTQIGGKYALTPAELTVITKFLQSFKDAGSNFSTIGAPSTFDTIFTSKLAYWPADKVFPVINLLSIAVLSTGLAKRLGNNTLMLKLVIPVLFIRSFDTSHILNVRMGMMLLNNLLFTLFTKDIIFSHLPTLLPKVLNIVNQTQDQSVTHHPFITSAVLTFIHNLLKVAQNYTISLMSHSLFIASILLRIATIVKDEDIDGCMDLLHSFILLIQDPKIKPMLITNLDLSPFIARFTDKSRARQFGTNQQHSLWDYASYLSYSYTHD